uniref:Uncharacterized protein n=1 Tax=Yamagishiella unicocca TaxID=51707 RepID=A0A1W6R6P0_9CHLO|nr:hypothetical protein [Yamagishiella unicocca]
MYRFRVAVTPKGTLAYGVIGSLSAIGSLSLNKTERGVMSASWTSAAIPGLTAKQPVLNVDTTTNRVYFVHPADGRIYCYDASLSDNLTSPVWVSDVVCSLPEDEREQHLQVLSSNGKRLLARCNDTVIMLNSKGALVKTFKSSSVKSWVGASDLAAPIPVFSNFTRLQSSYSFKALVDPVDELQVSVLPTPVISDKVMYGIVEGMKPSPLPWMLDQYPDEYYWWMFALNFTDPKAPSLLWLTTKQTSRGGLAEQSPWVTDRALFITDYQQNGTRGFDRASGAPFYNYPANPYTKFGGQYGLVRGSYKMSLPWVDKAGFFQVLQLDDWQYDQMATPGPGSSMGNIRTLYGTPYSPPRPPSPSPPPPPPM